MTKLSGVPRRVAIYGRVSTVDQDAQAQLVRLREWAKLHGQQVVLERVDEASGRAPRRPGLDGIMAEARGHHVDQIIVCKVDRWARSLRHLTNSLQELRDIRVGWAAVDQGIVISPAHDDPTTNLTLNVLGAVAEWEGSIIGERTREALAYRRDVLGVRLGRPLGSKDQAPRSNKGYLNRYAESIGRTWGGTPRPNKPPFV